MKFKRLFTPGCIGSMEVKNRIVLPAIGLNYLTDGSINERYLAFYEARARGGVGLIVATALLEHTGEKGYEQINAAMGSLPSLRHDSHIPEWQALAERVHRHGAKLAVQIFHIGKYADSSILGGESAVSPSAIPSNMSMTGKAPEIPRALTVAEIKQIQRNFVSTSVRAKRGNVDAVELNVCSGYLMREFLSPITNQRTDEYGGSLENRMRFMLETIAAIKAAVGNDYPVTVRLSADEFLPKGRDLAESQMVAKRLQEAGIAAISVVGGGHDAMIPTSSMVVPRAAFVYLARGIKDAVSIPVIASCRINTPQIAEQILADHEADYIAIGRGLIADPEFPNKAQAEKEAEIRPCIACNQGCFDAVFEGKAVGCLMNAQAGMETERKISPATTKKKVMVIGGGPAGMEAARVLAMRGHKVSLFEKGEVLGGQVPLAAAPPGRDELYNLPTYYGTQLDKLGVRIQCRCEVDAKLIDLEKPDAIVVATGAEPFVPKIPGIDGPQVVSSWEVLAGKATAGRRVVVLGGGSVGCEAAMYLAEKGATDPAAFAFLARHSVKTSREITDRGPRQVTIVEMRPRIGMDFGRSNRRVFMDEIKRLDIKSITGAEVIAITDAGVRLKAGDKEELLPADTVVLAVGCQKNDRLYEQLKARGGEVYVIGDAQKPRTILDAIHEGFATACRT